MKIIGKSDGGYIIEASSSEVANLIGFYSAYTNMPSNMPKVGATIDVHSMYQQLYKLSHMQYDLDKVVDILETYARNLKPIVPIKIEIPKND